MSFLSTAVQQVLEQGPFCAVASSTPRGPHCTPLVFAYSGGRIWLTTSRGSVKARAWKIDPGVAGLVRFGELSVAFTGTVHAYDALDRSTWGSAVAGATSIARAGAGFSRKNAKFFAGYAFDAHQVPFAWTPPGRVFVGIDLERTALLGEDGVQEGRGRWGGEALSHKTFRSTKGTEDPMTPLPSDVRSELGTRGDASLTLAGDR
ncbi:MAG: pyridoxamine 5'-phosphate oxidase family protein, partial [Actinomycetota bacterium]